MLTPAPRKGFTGIDVSFEKAVEIENTINAKDTDFGRYGLRLHPARVPLAQAVGDQIELLPADDMENCESGYCHT